MYKMSFLSLQDIADLLLLPMHNNLLSGLHMVSLLCLAFNTCANSSPRLHRALQAILSLLNLFSYLLIYIHNYGEGSVLGSQWMDYTHSRYFITFSCHFEFLHFMYVTKTLLLAAFIVIIWL